MHGTVFRTVEGLLELVRPRASLSAPIMTAIGWDAAGGSISAHGERRLVLCMLSSLGIICFCQVFNDIADRGLDAQQKPWRPLPAGKVSLTGAVVFATLLLLVAVVASVLVSWPLASVCVGCALLGAAYSLWAKSTVLVGNLVVATVSSTTFAIGAIGYQETSPRIFLGQAILAMYMLGHELFKTALDAEGDAEHGLRTIATAWGLSAAAIGIVSCWAGLAASLVLPGAVDHALAPSTWLGLVGVVVPTGRAALLVLGDTNASRFLRGFVWWRAAWIPGIAAVAIL